MAERDTKAFLGRDLAAVYRSGDGRHEDVDLAVAGRSARGPVERDLAGVEGVAAAVQAIVHRLKTRTGELAGLGHPGYGSRHHELIGQPNDDHNRNLVKLHVLRALAAEPRVDRVLKAEVRCGTARDTVEIALTLALIGSPVPQNLVVPFCFEGAA